MTWRNSPRSLALGSPMQRLVGRQARTLLPVLSAHLEPKTIDPNIVVRELEKEKQRDKANFDRGTRHLPALACSEPVRMLDPHEDIWKRGTVVQVLPYPRSYLVKDSESGAIYRRNRQMLRQDKSSDPHTEEQGVPKVSASATSAQGEIEYIRRSVRIAERNKRKESMASSSHLNLRS